MPGYSGPKIQNINDVVYIYQPGEITKFNHKSNVVTAPDVSSPVDGKLNGPMRVVSTSNGDVPDDVSNNGIGPVVIIENISNSIYTLTEKSTYTLSLWVKIANFPSSLGGNAELNSRTKRTSIARFNYALNETDGKKQGYIEFGATAPYYLDSNGEPTYKFVFEPISIGVAISSGGHIKTIYTDYKFYLNQWYFLTVELNSDSTFYNKKQFVNTKLYVNDIQEQVVEATGIPWRQHKSDSNAAVKRRDGYVCTEPGFVTHRGKQLQSHDSRTFLFNNFMDLTKLNYISYSPIKVFSGKNDGINQPTSGGSKHGGKYQTNSNIDFGQLYIYSSGFNKILYDNFKTLYK